MRHPGILAISAVLGLLSGCAAKLAESPSGPPRSAALTPKYHAEIVAMGSAFFSPDGHIYLPFGDKVLVTTPQDPAQGEILSHQGSLHPIGKRLFGTVRKRSSPDAAFVELDWRLAELGRVAVAGATPFVDLSPSGAYATIMWYFPKPERGDKPRPISALYRTHDFSELLPDVGRSSVGAIGALEASPDERYIVVQNRVVDTKSAKVVFAHRSLDRSAYVFEGHRLHWLFDDLLETVDLDTGTRTLAWQPCRGKSKADARRGILYSACATGLAKVTFAEGAPTTTVLPYPTSFEPNDVRVEESGRVTVSKRARSPEQGLVEAPGWALAPGSTTLQSDDGVFAAGQAFVERGPSGQKECRVVLADGRLTSKSLWSCEAKMSRDGRFLLSPTQGAWVLRSLPDEKTLATFGGGLSNAFDGKLTLEDGELVVAKQENDTFKAVSRIRLGASAPNAPAPAPLRVRLERRPEGTAVNTLTEHESVVLESGAGATIAKFEFTPFYRGTALLAGGEIVVHSSAPGELGLFQPYHCKRDGQCAPLFEGGKVLGFDGPEALGTFHVEGAFAFVREDLRTQVQVSVPLPEAMRGVLAVEDGWVLSLSEGGLAHVSRATNKVDRCLLYTSDAADERSV